MKDWDKIKKCIVVISAAYDDLDEAKQNCEAIVESSLEELAGATTIMKEDVVNIKKMAKAISNQKREKLVAEANSLFNICEIFE